MAILERRYEARVEEMLRDVEVPPEMGKGLLTRWETFAEPFAAALDAPAQRRHALEDGTGLLSHLGHKTGVAIASLQDQERPGLLKFLGPGPWDHQPSLATRADQVGEPWGEPDAVLVFDPSGFPQKATKSGGVARPGCGRLGQVDNCPVGASRADLSPTGPALVDRRLSLPEGGAKDRGRREEAGVPKAVSFPTRHELAWEMLTGWGGRRPHPGVAGDDERGRPWGFRQGWPTRNERDLLAAPSNLLIRDLEVAPPEDSGRGRPPQVPIARWDRWCGALAESAWTRIDGRDGANGAVVIDAVQRRTEARTEPGGTGPEELRFLTRDRPADNTSPQDSSFTNAAPGTPLKERARVATAEHRIEEGVERAQGEAGWADDPGRNWRAWPPDQTQALRAAWFLTQEARRGKNPDPCAEVAATSGADRGPDRVSSRHRSPRFSLSPQDPLATPPRTRATGCTSVT